MTKPARFFLFSESVVPSSVDGSCRIVDATGAPFSNVDDYRPGRMFELGDSFILRSSGTKENNDIEWTDSGGGSPYLVSMAAGSYTGAASSLPQIIANAMNAVSANYSCSYSTTTRKFTISNSASNFTLKCATGGAVTQKFFETIGFDTSADKSGASSYTSDNEVYVEDYQWFTLSLGTSGTVPIEALFLYSTTLEQGASIKVYGHASDLGDDPDDWETHATYVGAERWATGSEFNDIFCWSPKDDGSGALGHWMIRIDRSGDQADLASFKVGVMGMIANPRFDGADYDRDFATPWRWRLTGGNVGAWPADGGGYELGQRRGWVGVEMPFVEWDETTYKELAVLAHRYQGAPLLVMLDPDDFGAYSGDGGSVDLAPEKVLFCTIDGDLDTTASGVEDHRTFTLRLRQIPMHPKGV